LLLKTEDIKNTWCLSNSIILGCNTQFSNYTDLAGQELDSFFIGTIALKNIVHHYKKGNSSLVCKMFGGTIQKGNLPVTIPIENSLHRNVYPFPIQYAEKDSNVYSFTVDLNAQGINFKNVVNGKRSNEQKVRFVKQ
jgi:hypothetical protein